MALVILAAVIGGCGRDQASGRMPLQGTLEVVEEQRIGNAQGAGTLGLIADVATDAENRVYVLDAAAMRVKVLGRGGGEVLAFGGSGRGPGEFIDPAALSLDSADAWVVDRATRRLEGFSRRTGERTRTVKLELEPSDACTIGNHLFVLGLHAGKLIHQVSRETGRVLRSMAPDPAEDELLSLDRTGGYLACGPGDTISYLPSLRPVVERYSTRTGARLDTAPIPGYRVLRVHRSSRGGVVFEAPESGSDYGAALVPLPGGRQLVQIGSLRRGGSPHEFENIRSFAISWRTGKDATELQPLPRVLATRGAKVFAAVSEPFPQLLVFRLDQQKEGSR